jgi:hypothetical protein
MRIDKSSIAALNAVIEFFGNQDEKSLSYSDYRDAAAGDLITIGNPDTMSEDHVSAILNKMAVYGYALVKTNGVEVNQGTITAIADKIKIGDPFVPPYYKAFAGQIEVNKGINTIGSSGHEPSATDMMSVTHNAFGTTDGQNLHVDGTVQAMGQIKTSIVLCHTRAQEGGLSTFFNSTAVFRELVHENPDAAIAMLDNRALARAVDTDLANPHVAPVFSLIGSQLYSRFSIDRTSYWENGFQSVPNLKRAYDHFVEKVYEGSPYYKELQLEGGEAVIMANAQIAHGRTAYRSYPHAERKMYRALYEAYPK